LRNIEKIKSDVKGVFAGKKVLVTGDAGFVGSWLCDVLVGFGADVTAVDDLSTGRMKNIDQLMQNPKFKHKVRRLRVLSRVWLLLIRCLETWS
jgi:nucleoside-diphosphate-sugar epimerase